MLAAGTIHRRSMRISYVLPFDPTSSSGLLQRVTERLGVLVDLGHEVQLVCFGNHGVAPIDVPGVAVAWGLGRGRWAQAAAANVEVRQFDPHVVYARFMAWYPGLERIAREFPTVFEVHGDEVDELVLNRMWVRAAYAVATRRRLLTRARGFVFITCEIAQLPRLAKFAKPSVTISNGIQIPAQVSEAPNSSRPRVMMAVGRPAPWQGSDKFLRLAELLPDVDFVYVGSRVDLPEAQPNVTVTGSLLADGVAAELARADAAVSTLALHRKGLNAIASLKAREALALGVPLIYAYEDPDLEELDDPMLLRLDNLEDNIETGYERIHEFVLAARGQRIDEQTRRAVDIRSKEEARVAFIEQFAAG